MCFERKREELDIYGFLQEQLVFKDCLSIKTFLKLAETNFASLRKEKHLRHFRCRMCVATVIGKFPDCVLVDEKIFTNRSRNIPDKYNKKYDDCATVGSFIIEILTTLNYMLAKLELYEFLVNILNIEEEVSLDFIKAESVKISHLCRRTFTCEHILLRAIEELPHIFCVSNTSSNSTEKCIVRANGQIQELWDAFGTDSLLTMLLETYLQLTAETQLYVYLLNSQHVYKTLIELHKIVQNISESCGRYFSKMDCLETFLSFYFNFNLFDEKEDLLEKIKDHLKLFALYGKNIVIHFL
ncbi:uncharacterized protein [Centruroides vittatus]|uniref:uncharacterized protein n=1 Tax=Centruroides vittatus TaxID=120091 RepID=UPI00350EC98D